MANEPTVSDLVAERLRGLLKDQGMTVRDLADRCKAVGMPKLTAQALYKLVGQRARKDRPPRPVTVDELLVLAYALDVNPLYLICGLDDEAVIPVAPQIRPVSAMEVWNWVQGLSALPGVDKEAYAMSLPARMRADFVRNPEDALEVIDRRLEELRSLREDLMESIGRNRGLQERLRNIGEFTLGGEG
jgi:transcriptional regulator with XRE-family HTH domain